MNKNLQDIFDKWDFLCEDLKDRPEIFKNTAIVLENSVNHMIENKFTTEEAVEALITEDDATPNNSQAVTTGLDGSSSSYVVPKVMLPIIRRVMPQLIANELVSVQPIQGRQGIIFYARYKYSNSKGGITKGQEWSGNYPQDSAEARTFDNAFMYSSNKIGPNTVTVTAGATATITDDFFKTGMHYTGLEVYPVAGGAAEPATLTTTQSADGVVTFTLDDAAKGGDFVCYVSYDQEGTSEIPEVEFTIASKTVETKERKLKVRFTQEAVLDLKAHQGLDLESELVKMASVEMNFEIDREIIHFIDASVPAALSYVHNWNFNGDGQVFQLLDRHKALVQSLYALSGKLAQFNRQGAANWAVISPKVAAVLQMLPEFTRNEVTVSPNIYSIGTLSRIKFFVDPNRVGTDEDSILIGFKSNVSSYGAGVVYSPYANWMSPDVLDPSTFVFNKGFISRYAVTLAPRGEYFYGRLRILNLGALGAPTATTTNTGASTVQPGEGIATPAIKYNKK